MSNRNRPTDYQIVSRGIEMLRHGTLPSVLLDRLMDEFGLTPEKAEEMAAAAIKRHKRGKGDTLPLDEPG